jgi:hypothetical protein
MLTLNFAAQTKLAYNWLPNWLWFGGVSLQYQYKLPTSQLEEVVL